jgi:hypothetical protein
LSTKLEKLLTVLSDDQWHDPSYIMTMLGIHEDELRKTITFLADAGLVERDSATNHVKLDSAWKSFLANQKEMDSRAHQSTDKPTIGTIIVPPQRTLVIQCTRITNLTESSLELGIRLDNRIREITIDKVK